MIYFYCTSWQFFQMIVKWRISPTTEQIMFTFSILLFHFYSHIPCGMWLSYIWSIKITKIISTHTSRVGCDRYTDWSEILVINFYSHIPCGMWPQWQYSTAIWQKFLLTHPVWDVTSCILCCSTHIQFLLTHPVWDVTDLAQDATVTVNFYSHIPCGMWRIVIYRPSAAEEFLLTHPVWDVTAKFVMIVTPVAFLLTHPVWDVTTRAWRTHESHRFLLTHPVWDVTV